MTQQTKETCQRTCRGSMPPIVTLKTDITVVGLVFSISIFFTIKITQEKILVRGKKYLLSQTWL